MNPVQFFSSSWLNGLAWAGLLAIPLLVVLLYFLKLKRQPLVVPSTYLWSRTIEDLHVNTIWQRLRQNLLLFLQLLLLALIMLACLRLGWRDVQLTGNRFIFVIDNSASMNAADVEPTRLELAKQKVLAMIDRMESGDAAMVVSFSDIARPEQPFTDNRRRLREAVESIDSTHRVTDIREALRYAAGLANPQLTRLEGEQQIDESMPAQLYIFSDGGFAAVPEFSLGNLTPHYIAIGEPAPANVGIVAFSTQRNVEKPEQMQAFARLENYGPEEVTTAVNLNLNATLLDATQVTIPAQDSAGVQFELASLDEGVLELEIQDDDALSVDNTAYVALNPPRLAKILLVTPGNTELEWALATDQIAKLAQVEHVTPAHLKTDEYKASAAAGAYDLIIYDQAVPEVMPQANTLFIGDIPPDEGWIQGEVQGPPLIIDINRAHPIMHLVEMGDVRIYEGFPARPPAGGTVLLDADIGPLFAIAPRQGFEDAVLGFHMSRSNEEGELQHMTDWPIRLSFPVFIKNMIEYLGGSRAGMGDLGVQPGQPMAIRTTKPVSSVVVESPGGETTRVEREGQNTFMYTGTDRVGVYEVREGNERDTSMRFTVNLFDGRESDLVPRETIELGHEDVEGQAGLEPARRELWKWILIVGLVVLVFEWYVYNRRVYL